MDIDILEQEFKPKEIKKRKGPGGKYLDYVETHSVIKRLNTAFSHNWSFSIEKYEIVDGHVIVLGKLTAEGIVKSQFGSKKLARDKQGEPVSIGDDLKSAASDSLKKTSTLMGVGLHLYQDDTDNSMDSMSPNKGNGRITKEQLNAIKALRTKAGMVSHDVLDLTERMFQTRDPMNLNKEMASAVIAVLEYMQKGNGKPDESSQEVV
ncbi:hypothetical protein GF312_12585 [Candidatus Poribacteria bacterium]|nr:hypothetical protein [Candidatus Poribacteria bacterium]